MIESCLSLSALLLTGSEFNLKVACFNLKVTRFFILSISIKNNLINRLVWLKVDLNSTINYQFTFKI